MAIVVFKPMKGSWMGSIVTVDEFYEGKYYLKIDKSDCKEQLHLSLSDVEAYALVRDLLRQMKKGNEHYLNRLKNEELG